MEGKMKTIIVYYSLEGNSEYAASRIASILNADTLRLEPVKTYPNSGFRKFFWGGKSAMMGETPDLRSYQFVPEKYDRVILGFPVWAGTFAPPIRTFIKENNLKGKHIAAFACQSGSGAEKAFGKLRALLNIDKLEAELILIDPKDKPSGENDRKIDDFCKKMNKA